MVGAVPSLRRSLRCTSRQSSLSRPFLTGGGVTGAALAASGHGAAPPARRSAAPASRLDDAKALLPQARISEQQAIAGAPGALNEVDLERYHGQLVFNVDIGSHDVKVDATTGEVLGAGQDDRG
jgi:Peptidase propeptide and YPEB domain